MPPIDVDVSIQRMLKGLFNRLSESNLAGIATDFEKVFSEYPRQKTTQLFSEQLLQVLCSQVGLVEPFVMLYVSLLGQVSHFVGIDILAFFVTHITQKFDNCLASLKSGSALHTDDFKEKNLFNMIFFLSFLYVFGLISVQLLLDLALELSEELDELSVELLLKLLKCNCFKNINF
jgi:nucleolar MIF4G domain-containing protein 1